MEYSRMSLAFWMWTDFRLKYASLTSSAFHVSSWFVIHRFCRPLSRREIEDNPVCRNTIRKSIPASMTQYTKIPQPQQKHPEVGNHVMKAAVKPVVKGIPTGLILNQELRTVDFS